MSASKKGTGSGGPMYRGTQALVPLFVRGWGAGDLCVGNPAGRVGQAGQGRFGSDTGIPA